MVPPVVPCTIEKETNHIFKMPWAGDPRINLQEEGNQAKPYQVQQVIRALNKLKEQGT